MVDPGEVGHDDRHGQGDHQHAGQRTHAAHNLTRGRVGYHVTVSVNKEKGVNIRYITFTFENRKEKKVYCGWLVTVILGKGR